MTTITFGFFFNMNCDVVDYLMAHILSYLVAGCRPERLVLSIPLLCAAL
jgi:hypothetical protein